MSSTLIAGAVQTSVTSLYDNHEDADYEIPALRSVSEFLLPSLVTGGQITAKQAKGITFHGVLRKRPDYTAITVEPCSLRTAIDRVADQVDIALLHCIQAELVSVLGTSIR